MKSLDTNVTSIKIPATEYPVARWITRRWSARSFSDTPVPEHVLNTLFEAASWAPSSMNEQPWHYLYAHRGSAGFERLFECLTGGNRKWAGKGAVMILSLAKRNLDRTGTPNRHFMYDVGAANATLLLQAADMDIYGHIMGGFDMDKTLKTFEIDANTWEPACFIVLGYLGAPDALEEPFLTRERTPRVRKNIEEFTQPV